MFKKNINFPDRSVGKPWMKIYGKPRYTTQQNKKNQLLKITLKKSGAPESIKRKSAAKFV